MNCDKKSTFKLIMYFQSPKNVVLESLQEESKARARIGSKIMSLQGKKQKTFPIKMKIMQEHLVVDCFFLWNHFFLAV